MAARNLLADKRFSDAVLSIEMAAPQGGDAVGLKPIKMRQDKVMPDAPLKKNITDLRMAVAIIVVDNKRTGSGFFVSPDGYWLTIQHVVGTSRFVKVKLTTGRELAGEVIRTDAARDVALIKTEPISLPTITISPSELNIGDEVYALGSPMGESFNATLT